MSAITKALIQNEAGKQSGIANLIATVYTAASTKADVRGWEKTPAKWYLAKLNPKKRQKHPKYSLCCFICTRGA
jgi:hypothetical protein